MSTELNCAGRLFKHTPKGVKRGEPKNRIFLVVERWDEDNRYFVAWKCELLPSGKYSHPAFSKRKLSLDELLKEGIILKGKNGSGPTAIFKPDSLYEEILTKKI